MTDTALIAGAGVIGAGWAVRFLAFGWHVCVYDLDKQAPARVEATLKQAQSSVTAVYPQARFNGDLTFISSLSEMPPTVSWIQESLPEALEVKRDFYRSLQGTQAIVASSTSGFKPSDLGAGLTVSPLVCHPFNPVYLLPLVEVVAPANMADERKQHVHSKLRGLGMHPVSPHKEIDAHIADRLLEAVWREALWLIKDGVATTQQVDEAITHGFGLRWAQMGLFETYRLAGGEGGFAHFLRQFGPALQWPWSRLTDVPELDEALVRRIVEQSDEQAQGRSIAELSAIRDANLVALLAALKEQNWGAGKAINQFNATQQKAQEEG